MMDGSKSGGRDNQLVRVVDRVANQTSDSNYYVVGNSSTLFSAADNGRRDDDADVSADTT